MRRLLPLSLAILALPAWAQEPPPIAEEPAIEEEPAFEVEVVGENVNDADTHATTTLGTEALERAQGQDLAETVGQVPGVAVARGTSDQSKPIIRGQYERRLLLLFDGVRHESQKWGSDHAPEIDPFAAGEIRVIKGAAGVRYGPDAVGGVVLVEPPPLRDEPGIGGSVGVVGVTNGRRGVVAARVDGNVAALPALSWRAEGNYARGAALSAPDYVLGNTASEQWNAGVGLGWKKERYELEISYRHYDFRGGVCYCIADSSPEELLAQADGAAPVGADAWTTSYAIDRPYQEVGHDLALARANVDVGDLAALTVTYAFQLNRRREYDQVRESVTGPQYDFTLRTHTLDAWLDQGDRPLAGATLAGGAGLSGTFQENVYAGLPLLPNYRSLSGGVFGVERLKFAHGAVEAGARYDRLGRTAYLGIPAYDKSIDRGTLDVADCSLTPDAAACAQDYDAGTATLGGVWDILPGDLEVRLDLSSATRFPNADELYLNGTAPTSPVFALGDPDLGPETSWSASPTLGLALPWLEAEVSTYLTLIDDYVYFAPELGADGEPAIDVTIQGAFPRYAFRAIDARFYGIDGGLTLGPDAPVTVGAQASIVRASDRSTGEWLVLIPPDRVEGSVQYRPHGIRPLRETFLLVGAEYVFRQTRVDPRADLAPPPPGYVHLDAALGTQLAVREATLKLGIEGHNLLNATYRDYTSLLRYYADEPGRELRFRADYVF